MRTRRAASRSPHDGAILVLVLFRLDGVDSWMYLAPAAYQPVMNVRFLTFLIAACAAVRNADSPSAIIVGDGPERPALAAAARAAGVNLSLPGWVPRSALARWLHAADVYAQPSAALPSGRTEGTPVAALEALAVGLPVVATTDAGLSDLTPRPNGLELVPAHDTPAFGLALARHLSRFRVDNVTAV